MRLVVTSETKTSSCRNAHGNRGERSEPEEREASLLSERREFSPAESLVDRRYKRLRRQPYHWSISNALGRHVLNQCIFAMQLEVEASEALPDKRVYSVSEASSSKQD